MVVRIKIELANFQGGNKLEISNKRTAIMFKEEVKTRNI